MRRDRITLLIALAATIAVGLATRSSALPWPDFVTLHFGDALWTVALYLTIAFANPSWPPFGIAVCALGGSFLVEFGQRLQYPWLIELRGTRWGGLLLGSGFDRVDLIRYTAGAFAAFALDRLRSSTAEPSDG